MNAATVSAHPSAAELERYRRFGEELDALRTEVLDEVGQADLDYVTELDRFSHRMETIGRTLIHVSLDPVTFSLGVAALWLHKQLQAAEIGHTVLHGAYDRIPGSTYSSQTYVWDIPIDEEAWRYGHNALHHGATNVAGRDPDIHYGPVRLTEQTPHSGKHRWQLPFALFVMWPNFGFLMNWHFTGLSDVYFDNGLGEGRMDFLADRSEPSVRGAWRKALRKWVPYYARSYGVFPALAGPFFWKVALGNWLAETARDIYSAATIYCGHVGEETASYPEGTRAKGRGHHAAMVAAASNNFEVPRWVSVLCGGLDKQIEHHLFPTLAPERLRQVAPRVRAICERHGVPYRTASWPKTLGSALRHIVQLSREGGPRAVLAAMA